MSIIDRATITMHPLHEYLTEYKELNSDNKYRPVAVGRYGIRTRESIYSKELAKDYSKNRLIYKGTLTVGMGSVQMDIGILSDDAIYSVSPAYHTYKIAGIDYDYLRYCLQCRNMDMFARYMKRGSRQGKSIDLGRWITYEIPVYPVQAQKAIVERLDRVQRVIDARRRELSDLDELIKARFVEMFGEPRNNMKYGFVPFDDVVEYMGDIGSNGANKVVVEHLDMKDEEDYALMVRFLNFTKNDFTEDVKFISKESYDFFKKSQLHGGELIICKIGSAGLNYVMPDLKRPVSLGLNQIMVRINEKIIMPYLYQYLHTDYGEYLISGCINGAVTKSITKTELKKIPIMLPSIDEQKAYADFLEKVDKSKVAVQKALDEAQLLFDSLMQNYFG